MYDIARLEQQWKRYRRKRILLQFFSITVVIAVVGLLYFIFVKYHNSSFDSVTRSSVDKNSSPEALSAKKDTKKKSDWIFSFSNTEKRPDKQLLASKSKHIDIKVTDKKTKVTAKDIEERFITSGDKDDALFLSRYYYYRKQYQKALKWALETNKIDSGIEESWLIFGMSKARLGAREEAIKVLQTYYDHTDSKKAKLLLDKIRRGKVF